MSKGHSILEELQWGHRLLFPPANSVLQAKHFALGFPFIHLAMLLEGQRCTVAAYVGYSLQTRG